MPNIYATSVRNAIQKTLKNDKTTDEYSLHIGRFAFGIPSFRNKYPVGMHSDTKRNATSG